MDSLALNPASILNKTPEHNSFRLARFSHFLRLLKDIPETTKPVRILDIGGTEKYWTDKFSIIGRPINVTLVNLRRANVTGDCFVSIEGDARKIDFSDMSFDAVHSNSVIEHVGLWRDMKSMANEVRRLAPRYFVQTPYYWFPIEPHTRTPFFHWLPDSLKFRLAMTKSLGPFWGKCSSVDEAMTAVHSARIIDRRMFQTLFPDAKIESEKFFGFTKSLMAIR